MKILNLVVALLVISTPCFASDMSDQILAVHNEERTRVGAPPLVWSHDLSDEAGIWADHLAATGTFGHSSTNDGENLWMGTAGFYKPDQMAQTWADEKAKFKYDTFPDVSTDGNWANVGHYTQMIWSRTTEVGCARSTAKGWDILVCRYRSAGNVYGQKPY